MIKPILIIIILYYLFYKYKNTNIEKFSNNKSYKRCKEIKGIYSDVLQDYNINITNNNDWNLYIPCGYNKVENELKLLNINNKEQIIFGINGCDKIVSKPKLWNSIKNKYGIKKASKLMPCSYILNNDDDMKYFIKKYKQNKLYIMKGKEQRKKGIKITRNLEEILNGKYNKFLLVQEYLDNIFLINKRKLNLRCYVVILCHNNNIEIYIHKNGKCIFTNQDYNINSDEFEKHITSFNLDTSIYNINPFNFYDLEKHFNKYNINYKFIMNKIYNNLRLVSLSFKNNICNLKKLNKNKSYQLFGIDYILDNNLNPYLLEFNKGPNMKYNIDKDYKLKYEIIEDVYSLMGIIDKQNNNFVKIDL